MCGNELNGALQPLLCAEGFLRSDWVVENVSLSLDLGEFPNFFIDSYTFSKIKPVLTYVAEGFRVPFHSFCAE